jgi:hypothetical protein
MATVVTYVGFQGSYLSNEQSGTNQGIYFRGWDCGRASLEEVSKLRVLFENV